MSLILDLDPQSQQDLEHAFGGNLSRTALEALIAEGYRSNKLTRAQVQKLLGLADLWTTEAWLKEHRAIPETTIDDVLRDFEASRATRETSSSSSPTTRP